MDTLIYVIFMGILQGLTEFLPISSSGHLALFEELPIFRVFSAEIEKNMPLLAFNVFLHIGTLFAVILFYRRDLKNIISGFFIDLKNKTWTGPQFKLGLLIIFATLPAVVAPLLKKTVEMSSKSLTAIGVFFIVNGVILVANDKLFLYREKKDKTGGLEKAHQMKFWHATLVGLFQVMAILPGISRSGSTISGGLLVRLRGEEAVRFSFLLSIPVILGAIVFEAKDVLEQAGALSRVRYDWVFAGVFAAFGSGIAALKLLVWLGKKHIFYPFGIYTALLGIIILIAFKS